MKQKFTYLLSLMLMCILGASNATAEVIQWKVSSVPDGGIVSHPNSNVLQIAFGKAVKDNANNWLMANVGKKETDVTDVTYGGTKYSFDKYASTSNVNGSNSNSLKADGTSEANYIALVPKFDGTIVVVMHNGGTGNEEKPTWLYEDGVTKGGTIIVDGTKNIDYDGKTDIKTLNDGTAVTGGVKFSVTAGKTYTMSINGSKARWSGVIYDYTLSSNPPSITTDLKASYNVLRDEKLTLTVDIKDAVEYQWYKCNDANKTGAEAISGAVSASYTPKTTAAGTVYYYCVGKNAKGSATSTVAAVVVENAKWVSRNWLFTQQSKYAADQAAATTLWGNYSTSNKRYENARALAQEELSGNDGPLYGLAGIYFTAPASKLLLGGKDDDSRSMQTNGSGISMTIPGCHANDKITLRWSASGDGSEGSITYGDKTISYKGVNRNNTSEFTVASDGNVTISISNKVRLFEVTVSSKYYFVTSFELSTDEVSVEEFNTVSVSGKNFLPTNASDRTLNWTSSDDKVATVNGGVITGVKAGTATITATSVDGPSQTVAVTVTPCAPKNASIEMTSNSGAAAPKVESSKTYKLTAKAQGYDFTYQWASKTSEKGAWTNITGATDASYEETAVELGSKFYKVTITNAQGSTTAEYEVKTIAPLAAFTITEKDPETGKVTAINYNALDSDEPQVKVVYQETKAGEQTEVVIPASVEFAGLTYAVTNIGDEAYVNDNTVVSLATTKALKEIGARAFMFCSNLSEVSLVKGLEVIGDAAFRGCTSLTTFSIPSTVTSIGYKAFSDCDNLTDIYYDGTKDEWNALPNIEMAGISKTVTIHFKDGETVNGRGDFVGISNANADEAQKDGKFFKNGQIMIIKNGKVFNAAGAELK